MKKLLKGSGGIVFGILVVIGFFFYFKRAESDYDSMMGQAIKKQQEFFSFVQFDGFMEPSMPDSSLNNGNLLGVDSDVNGIRDDLDIWANRMSYSQNERKAIRQYAKALQDWLKGCEEKKIDQKEIIEKNIIAGRSCLSFVSDYIWKEESFSSKKVDLLMINTEMRKSCMQTYFTFSGALNPFVKETFQNQCTFEIQYPENVVSGVEYWKALRPK